MVKIYGGPLSPNISEGLQVSPAFVDSAQKNIENCIGGVTIPLGVVGRIPICGMYATGEYLVPIATTEACLVASIQRGIKLIRDQGKVATQVQKIGISRAPVLQVKKIKSVSYYQQILEENREKMQAQINKISSHLTLIDFLVRVVPQNKYVFVHFRFDSADAMGMNMATIATKKICTEVLEPLFDGQLLAVSSNWCSDKKPAQIHTEIGRGYHVTASINITSESLEKILGCTVKDLLAVYQAKIIEGSNQAGSLAANAHHANIVAGIFAATGQDLAHIVEGSHGSTKIEQIDKDVIEFKVVLPALVCGTVGGGTKVLSQSQVIQNILQLKKSAGVGDQSAEFAEIITATVLAGELSLLGAIAAQKLASSHDRFRR